MIEYDLRLKGFLKKCCGFDAIQTQVRLMFFCILSMAYLQSAAQTQDEALAEEANRLFEAGQFQKAYGAFSQLVSLNPSSGDYNYKFGACSVYADADKTKAVRYLKLALKYKCPDPMVHYYLGRALHLNYQFKEAQSSYKTFISSVNPKSKMISVAQLDMSSAANGSGLLSNIKDITVLNKTETDRVNFFRYYNLEGIGGRILALPEELKTKLDKKNNHNAIIHFPGNGTTLYFSSYGKDGTTGKDIYRANVLPDGTYSIPEKLGGSVNTNADEDFCFMHSDGTTLFFSSTGHNSMGGYDVFRSLYDPANNYFSPAVNLDFAINTPDDDIFYIADSLKQRAYFASGRSSDLDHLHVYNVLVESTPLQVVYFKGSYSNEIDPEETGYGFSIKEKSSGRVVCSGNARSSDGGYVSFVPKSGEYIMSVITSQSPKVHEISLNIPMFQKPVAIRQEAKLIDQGGDKLIVETYFDTPLDEDLSALASDMLRSKALLEVNVSEKPLPKKEETATMSTYDRSMQNAAIIAGFGAGTTVEGIMQGYRKDIEEWQQEMVVSNEKSKQSSENSIYAQREAEKLLQQAEKYKATGNPNKKATLDSLVFQMQLLSRADSLLILSEVYRQSAKSLPELAKQKQIALDRSKTSLLQLDSLYRTGDPELVISFLVSEKSNTVAQASSKVLKSHEEEFASNKQLLVNEENKLVSLRNKELETANDIKSNEAILKRTEDAVERQNIEERLAVLQQDLATDRKRILDQKLVIVSVNRKVIQSDKLLAILKNPIEELKDISNEDFSSVSPLNEADFNQMQRNLTTKHEALLVRDPKVQAMIEEAIAVSDNSDNTSHSTKVDVTSLPENASTPQLTVAENIPSSSVIEGNSKDSTSPTEQSVAKIESKFATEIKRASGRPDSLQILSMAEYNGTSSLWVERVRLEKLVVSSKATAADSVALENVDVAIARLAQNSPSLITPLSSEELNNEMFRQDPEFSERVLSLQNTGSASDLLDYKIQLIEQLMLARSENASALSGANASEALSKIASRDAEIERAIYTLMNEASEISQVKATYDSTMKALIESDMDYPQKLARQYDLTLKYENQLSQLVKSSAINGFKMDSGAMQFVFSERDAVRVKLIAYKKDIDRAKPAEEAALTSDEDNTAESTTKSQEVDVPTPSEEVGSNAVDPQQVVAGSATQTQNVSTEVAVAHSTEPAGTNQVTPSSVNQLGTNAQSISDPETSVSPANTNNSLNNEPSGNDVTKSSSEKVEFNNSSAEGPVAANVPAVIDNSEVYVTKANIAREEAGALWTEKSTASPQMLLSKPAQIGFSKVIASPQFKSMLYTSQSGKPIQRLQEYENNEREMESIDLRMQSANGNLDTLRTLDARKNKLLSIQNKIEIENAEEYSKIVKRNYNEQRLATDKRMMNLSAAVRNRSVLNDAMLSKLRKADSLMVEAVILKSEAAWAYNEEEKADLFKMALAKQIQSIEMLKQVELMGEKSKELLAMSDVEIREFAHQNSGVSTPVSPADSSVGSPEITENQKANDIESVKVNGTTDVDNPSKRTETGNVIGANESSIANTPDGNPSSTQTNGDQALTNSSDTKEAKSSNSTELDNNASNPSVSSNQVENDIVSPPVYIDPYKIDNTAEESKVEIASAETHAMIAEEKIPTATEQLEMSRPEQAKWMISVLKEPEELPETEVYDTGIMQELIEQQSAERSIKNKDQLIQLNQQILLLEGEMSNTNSKAQLRRLDYQREELYTQRASIEIENAGVIHEMAKHEYNERKLSADSLLQNAEKKAGLSLAIQDIVSEKYRISDSLMVQSLLFRAQAENDLEPLERAYYYREGFACLVKAIELMQQVKSIVSSVPALKTWSESDIARMSQGKMPAELITATDTAVKQNNAVNSVDLKSVTSTGTNPELAVTPVVNSSVGKTEISANIDLSSAASEKPTASIADAAEVKQYLYKAPDRVTKELSLLNAKGVYSVNNPIPIDAPMPKGIYFKVQVGAFRNKIPQNLFDGFAPLHGETVSNGVVRYTAGFYMTLDRAKSAKNQIRDLGYKDAFVVAFKDGVRIPIYEAIKATEGQAAADLFAAANPGAAANKSSTGPATNKSTEVAVVTSSANADKPQIQSPPPPPPPLVTGYTKEYKDAAPSTEVETIQGVFFTVQVGVYTTPVPLSKLFNLKPLNTELTETKKIRYTTGRYETLESATARRDEIRNIGVKDAFVTAYINGRRVTVAEALEKLKK